MIAFRILILYIGLLSPFYANAQNSVKNTLQEFIKNPETGTFERFSSENNVDLYTGKVSVPIPLYTIKSKALEHSIAINYSSDGVQVNSLSTWIGEGFNLEASGYIVRELRGHPDESTCGRFMSLYGYPDQSLKMDHFINRLLQGNTDYCANLLSPPYSSKDCEYELLYRLGFDPLHNPSNDASIIVCYDNSCDTQADVFRFSVGSTVGSFILDDEGYPRIIEGDQRITITTPIGPKAEGSAWVFALPDGTKYYFEDSSSYTETVSQRFFPKWNNIFMMVSVNENSSVEEYKQYVKNNLGECEEPTNCFWTDEFEHKSTWHLSKIVSGYDLTNEIYFTYSLGLPIEELNWTSKRIDFVRTFHHTFTNYNYSAHWPDDSPHSASVNYNQPTSPSGILPLLFTPNLISNQPILHTVRNPKFISSITFKGGRVEFVKSSTVREDLKGQHSLSEIKVYNVNEEKVKHFKLSQSYFISDENECVPSIADKCKRLRLDLLEEFSDENISEKQYIFDYNEEFNLPKRYSAKQDFWGYSNNNLSTHGIPATLRGGVAFSGADKSPNAAKAQTGLLKRITYPTAGFTEFFYQQNEYYNEEYGISLSYGGMRVSKTIDNDGASEIVRNYEYKNSTGNSSGSLVAFAPDPKFHFQNDMTYVATTQGTNAIVDEHHFIVRTSQPIHTLFRTKGGLVGYGRVSVSTPRNGKKITEFTSPKTNPDIEILKMRAPYRNMIPRTFPPDNAHTSVDCFRGIVTNELWIDDQDNKIKELIYSYDFEPVNFTNREHKDLVIEFPYIKTEGSHPSLDEFDVFHLNFQTYISRHYALKNIEEKVYVSNVLRMSTLSNFYYESNKHLFRTKTERINSEGRQEVELVKYSYDYTLPDNITFTGESEGIALLQQRSILTPVEQLSCYHDGVELKISNGNLSTFKKQNNNVIVPYKDYKFEVTSPTDLSDFSYSSIGSSDLSKHSFYSEKALYTFNPDGNLIQLEDNQGVVNSFIWGYNNTLPVATAVNAEATNILYTSFEDATSMGGWEFNPLNVASQGKTGERSFQSGTITRNSLPTGNYILAFWAMKSSVTPGNVAISGVGQTIENSDWQYYEFKFNSITSLSLNVTGAFIDELRLYPASARMTTYTHKPLVGIRSSTDANNVTTYYEYDALGRLKIIKDADSDIVKTYDYNYKVH